VSVVELHATAIYTKMVSAALQRLYGKFISPENIRTLVFM